MEFDLPGHSSSGIDSIWRSGNCSECSSGCAVLQTVKVGGSDIIGFKKTKM